jgi:hypothetical protein
VALSAPSSAVASSRQSPLYLAQAQGGQQGQEQRAGANAKGKGAGQHNPAAQTGANAGQTQSGATATGPPWTYQMAKLALLLFIVIALTVGFTYYRFVITRKRRAV